MTLLPPSPARHGFSAGGCRELALSEVEGWLASPLSSGFWILTPDSGPSFLPIRVNLPLALFTLSLSKGAKSKGGSPYCFPSVFWILDSDS
jgi:hypothetical protein